MERYSVRWPWLTSKSVVQVCQHLVSFLLSTRPLCTITSLNDCRMWWPSVCTVWHSSTWRKSDAAYADKETTDCMTVYSRSHPISCQRNAHPNDIVAHIRDSALHGEIEPHSSVTAPSSSQSMSPMPSTSSQLHRKTNSRTLSRMTTLKTITDHIGTDFCWSRNRRDP